jgi:hypothetical protein
MAESGLGVVESGAESTRIGGAIQASRIGQNRSDMTRSALLLGLACALLPSRALAHRAPPHAPSDGGRQGTSSGMAVDMLEQDELTVGVGGARRPPPPAPTTADVRGALESARPAIAACLDAAGYVGSVRVAARIETSHALEVTVGPRSADAGVRACVELEAQRRLANVAAEFVPRTLRASITVRRRAAAPPRHRRPSRSADAALAGPVHARLDQDRAALLQCLSSAAPGVVGRATLRVTLQPDGSLVLSSASLPTAVPAGPALPCLSGRIGSLRFAPAPSRPLAIDHTIELGL